MCSVPSERSWAQGKKGGFSWDLGKWVAASSLPPRPFALQCLSIALCKTLLS